MRCQSEIAHNIWRKMKHKEHIKLAASSRLLLTMQCDSFTCRASQQRPPSELANPIANLYSGKQLVFGGEARPQAVND
jgi:hypothetical protein